METIVILISITALIIAVSATAHLLGWVFTEVMEPPLKVKPFNCRPCLTFWLTVIFNALLAVDASRSLLDKGLVVDKLTVYYGLIGIGFLMGFINFFYLKSKYKIYE